MDLFLTSALINEQKANPIGAIIRAMIVAVHIGIRNCDNIKTFEIKDFRSSRAGELNSGEMRNLSSSEGRWLALRVDYVDLYNEVAGVHWIEASGKVVYDPIENVAGKGCEFPLFNSLLAVSFLVQALVVPF